MSAADPLSDTAAFPRLGVDTGGTFTDFALYSEGQLRTHKVLSTPEGPEKAILQGIEDMGLADACKLGKLLVIHGSTVATNAVLQGKGAKTLFITNSGLEDILTIGRQNREKIYDLRPQKRKPPIDSKLCLGISGRLDSQGNQIESLDPEELVQLLPRIKKLAPESVAICMLFSYLSPDHEKAIEAILKEDYFVSISSDVLPETGEYERGIATWLNASLGPLMESYLTQLARQIPEQNLSVMQSSGGTISCVQASRKSVNLLLSGPAGGLAAAEAIKDQINAPGLLTFDMGGTSTDVALIKQGIRLTREGRIGRYPVSVPMVDMHTIGAGGGSIAYLDEAGMLHVGPESAGAKPGPACYGLGGVQATVTDAHMLLGNLQAENFAGGNIELDRDASETMIGALAKQAEMQPEEMAQGILELANEHMARALRQILEQRGEDPATYRLCSFGGAGGLHVCALAERLEMRLAIIPANSGILSALGMLQAPGKRELSSVILASQKENLSSIFAQAEKLARQGRSELMQEGYTDKAIVQNFSLDCRYLGQTFTLDVPLADDSTYSSLVEAFNWAHESNFGYRLNRDVELVNVRAHLKAQNETLELAGATKKGSGGALETGKGLVYKREDLTSGQEILGPALICETSSTSWIAEGWLATVDEFGHLLLNRQI